jgi:hypothetical protein
MNTHSQTFRDLRACEADQNRRARNCLIAIAVIFVIVGIIGAL